MKLLSIQAGRPREVQAGREIVLTSIFKLPVTGPVRVGALNIDGDEQSDLTVHGGRDKAVYFYASEHYPHWRTELPDLDFSYGAFGENFTVEGLLETEVAIGDRLEIGTAVFEVSRPRMPCYKLGVRFNRLDMVKRFHRSGRSGFYARVVREGVVQAGDVIRLRPSSGERTTIAESVRLSTA